MANVPSTNGYIRTTVHGAATADVLSAVDAHVSGAEAIFEPRTAI